MVRITDNDGLDLSANPPAQAQAVAAGPTASIRLALQIQETDPDLPLQSLSGTLNWNDGGLPVVVSGAGTILVDEARSLYPGDYVIRLSARDYALPSPSSVSVNLPLKVLASREVASTPATIFGPILPRDQGFPGTSSWLFHSGTDLGILESSLKMLLTTARGERLMEPGYGTSLRQILFEPNLSSVETLVREEIVTVTSQWEPRVELQTLVVNRDPNAREVTVLAGFVSKITGRGFELELQFTR